MSDQQFLKESNLLIEDIKQFTYQQPKLWACHHFLFDKPITANTNLAKIDYIVMGINPGESAECRSKFPKRDSDPCLEETSRKNDLIGSTEQTSQQIRSSINWVKKTTSLLNTENIVLTEAFFWSTPNIKILKTLFSKEELNFFYRFCLEKNNELVELRKPKAIVFPGLSYEKIIAELYKLRPTNHTNLIGINGDRLATFWMFNDTPWIFTKHWTGARISNLDLASLGFGIRNFLGTHNASTISLR